MKMGTTSHLLIVEVPIQDIEDSDSNDEVDIPPLFGMLASQTSRFLLLDTAAQASLSIIFNFCNE